MHDLTHCELGSAAVLCAQGDEQIAVCHNADDPAAVFKHRENTTVLSPHDFRGRSGIRVWIAERNALCHDLFDAHV
jgi:hypothetical protein